MTHNKPFVASLRAGPAHEASLVLKGTSQWPEYVCVNLRTGVLPMHYKHIAAGIYEFGGACAEFDHEPGAVQRCPDCGSRILGKGKAE